ncbi:FAD-dependent oxidoreductase [Mesorhizobium marinum]|uniref:FAD-dependent oxidoreductase n=1 Tax=Mesorhizobium marinum TaxID=3228790 RepID=UPI0034662744
MLDLDRRPAHLIIVGGDASALELAQTFRRLGSQVTVLAEGSLVPREDPEMVAVLTRRLSAEGVTIREGVHLTAVERRGKTSVRVLVATGEGAEPDEIDGSHLMVAAGRTPDVAALDLKKARVALRDGVVDVSAMLRTTNRRIYAIGGVAGADTVQAARHQAGLVLKALLFRLPAKDRAIVPRLVGADPELASVGLTEAEAARRHRRLTILRWPYAENDRARAERKTDGHVKLVVARDGELLGVSIAGANASEMIGIWALALAKRLGLNEMAASIPPYPTTAEIGKDAAIAYFAGRARRAPVRSMVRLLRMFG